MKNIGFLFVLFIIASCNDLNEKNDVTVEILKQVQNDKQFPK
jgi:hypothetical protein